MSFTVTTIGGAQHSWHIQDKKPNIDIENIKSLYADGDENERIKLRFVNVPYCHACTMWIGEMAKFVFENLTR